MKELKEYFTGIGQVKGYIFNQISKTSYGFLYEVKRNDKVHYEVFKRRENTTYDCISYPTDKSFGKWAWTTHDLERAKEILREINFNGKLKNS